MQAFVDYVQKEFVDRAGQSREAIQNAIVRIPPVHLIRTKK